MQGVALTDVVDAKIVDDDSEEDATPLVEP